MKKEPKEIKKMIAQKEKAVKNRKIILKDENTTRLSK